MVTRHTLHPGLPFSTQYPNTRNTYLNTIEHTHLERECLDLINGVSSTNIFLQGGPQTRETHTGEGEGEEGYNTTTSYSRSGLSLILP